MHKKIFNNKINNNKYFAANNIQNKKEKKIKLNVDCDEQKHFLLENQVFNHKIGYNIYTSCKIKDNNDYILILRGWSHLRLQQIKNLPSLFKFKGKYHIPILPFKLN